MKRHQFMDLLFGQYQEEKGDWRDVKEKLPTCAGKGTKVKVKLDNGDETFAYFYQDKARWIEQYGQKSSFFWNAKSHEPLFNVIQWKNLNLETK